MKMQKIDGYMASYYHNAMNFMSESFATSYYYYLTDILDDSSHHQLLNISTT